MNNEINPARTTHAVHIQTIRGKITIDCEIGSKIAYYHYKPLDKIDMYHNGPCDPNNPASIKESLKRSHIEQTPEYIKLIQNAAFLVQTIANRPLNQESPVSNQETLPKTPINLTRYILKRILRNPLDTHDNQYFYYKDRTTWLDDPALAKHFKAKHNAIAHKKLLPNDINPDTIEILETTITLTPVSNQETPDPNTYYAIYHTQTNCYHQTTGAWPGAWHNNHHKATRYPTYHEAKTAKNNLDQGLDKHTIIRKNSHANLDRSVPQDYTPHIQSMECKPTVSNQETQYWLLYRHTTQQYYQQGHYWTISPHNATQYNKDEALTAKNQLSMAQEICLKHAPLVSKPDQPRTATDLFLSALYTLTIQHMIANKETDPYDPYIKQIHNTLNNYLSHTITLTSLF